MDKSEVGIGPRVVGRDVGTVRGADFYSCLLVGVQSGTFAPWLVCRHTQDTSQGNGYLGGSEKTSILLGVNSLTSLWGGALHMSSSPYASCLPSYFPAFLAFLQSPGMCSALLAEPHRLSSYEEEESWWRGQSFGLMRSMLSVGQLVDTWAGGDQL